MMLPVKYKYDWVAFQKCSTVLTFCEHVNGQIVFLRETNFRKAYLEKHVKCWWAYDSVGACKDDVAELFLSTCLCVPTLAWACAVWPFQVQSGFRLGQDSGRLLLTVVHTDHLLYMKRGEVDFLPVCLCKLRLCSEVWQIATTHAVYWVRANDTSFVWKCTKTEVRCATGIMVFTSNRHRLIYLSLSVSVLHQKHSHWLNREPVKPI